MTDIPPDLVIQVDPDRFRRAVASLLSNAVKFSGDGDRIRIGARLGNRGRVKIFIRDRGIGMEPSEIDRAFAPFVQLDDNLTRSFDGSGLGLPLARLLAELHGGSVRLASEAGVGTTAILELPAYSRAVDHRSMPRQVSRPGRPLAIPLSGHRS